MSGFDRVERDGEVFFVEAGSVFEEGSAKVWKEKLDKKSGKKFYVNLGSSEKKWSLPIAASGATKLKAQSTAKPPSMEHSAVTAMKSPTPLDGAPLAAPFSFPGMLTSFTPTAASTDAADKTEKSKTKKSSTKKKSTSSDEGEAKKKKKKKSKESDSSAGTDDGQKNDEGSDDGEEEGGDSNPTPAAASTEGPEKTVAPILSFDIANDSGVGSASPTVKKTKISSTKKSTKKGKSSSKKKSGDGDAASPVVDTPTSKEDSDHSNDDEEEQEGSRHSQPSVAPSSSADSSGSTRKAPVYEDTDSDEGDDKESSGKVALPNPFSIARQSISSPTSSRTRKVSFIAEEGSGQGDAAAQSADPVSPSNDNEAYSRHSIPTPPASSRASDQAVHSVVSKLWDQSEYEPEPSRSQPLDVEATAHEDDWTAFKKKVEDSQPPPPSQQQEQIAVMLAAASSSSSLAPPAAPQRFDEGKRWGTINNSSVDEEKQQRIVDLDEIPSWVSLQSKLEALSSTSSFIRENNSTVSNLSNNTLREAEELQGLPRRHVSPDRQQPEATSILEPIVFEKSESSFMFTSAGKREDLLHTFDGNDSLRSSQQRRHETPPSSPFQQQRPPITSRTTNAVPMTPPPPLSTTLDDDEDLVVNIVNPVAQTTRPQIPLASAAAVIPPYYSSQRPSDLSALRVGGAPHRSTTPLSIDTDSAISPYHHHYSPSQGDGVVPFMPDASRSTIHNTTSSSPRPRTAVTANTGRPLQQRKPSSVSPSSAAARNITPSTAVKKNTTGSSSANRGANRMQYSVFSSSSAAAGGGSGSAHVQTTARYPSSFAPHRTAMQRSPTPEASRDGSLQRTSVSPPSATTASNTGSVLRGQSLAPPAASGIVVIESSFLRSSTSGAGGRSMQARVPVTGVAGSSTAPSDAARVTTVHHAPSLQPSTSTLPSSPEASLYRPNSTPLQAHSEDSSWRGSHAPQHTPMYHQPIIIYANGPQQQQQPVSQSATTATATPKVLVTSMTQTARSSEEGSKQTQSAPSAQKKTSACSPRDKANPLSAMGAYSLGHTKSVALANVARYMSSRIQSTDVEFPNSLRRYLSPQELIELTQRQQELAAATERVARLRHRIASWDDSNTAKPWVDEGYALEALRSREANLDRTHSRSLEVQWQHFMVKLEK